MIKTKYLICCLFIVSFMGAMAQKVSKENAFKLQIDVKEDRLFVKGWLYQVASRIMRDHPDLTFVESDAEADGFKRVHTIRLSGAPSLSGTYVVNAGNGPEDEFIVKLNDKEVDNAAKAIASIFLRLNSKEVPKAQVDVCFESQGQAVDEAKFNEELTSCLNDSPRTADEGNYLFSNGCLSSGKPQNKYRVRGTLFSRTNPAEYYVEPQFEAPVLNVVIRMQKVNFLAEQTVARQKSLTKARQTQWDPSRVCVNSRHDINILLSLEDNLLVKLSIAQRADTRDALVLAEQLRQQDKPEIELFLLSFLKEKEDSRKNIGQNPLLAEICVRRAQIYLSQNNDNSAGNDFEIATKADRHNVAAAVGYARVLMSASRLREARNALNGIEKSATQDPLYNMARGDLSLQLAEENIKELDNAKFYYNRALRSETYKVMACQKLAKIYNDEGNRQAAIRYYTMALPNDRVTVSPQLAEIYYEMANAIEDDDDKALKYYDSAISLNHSNADYYYSKAYTWANQGNLDSAIQSYRLSIENDPGNEVRYFALGYTYHLQGSSKDAMTNYSKAVAINPEYLLALNNRSILYRLEENYKDALVDIDKAIALDPTYALVHYNKGLILQDSGEYELAISKYSESLRLDSTYMDCFFNRGKSYYFLSKNVEAEQDIRHYIKNVAKVNLDSSAYYYVGVSEYQNLKNDLALGDLSTYMIWRNDFFWSYYFRANVFRDLAAPDNDNRNLLDSSKHDYENAISLDPSNVDSYFELSIVCDYLHEYDNAVKWTKIGIHVADSTGVSFPELYGNLGWYLYEGKKFPEALEATRDALKQNDMLLYLRFNMGIISLCMGSFSEATRFYDDAIANLVKGNHDEGETDRVLILEDLGLTDLKELLGNSQGTLHENTAKMIAYLEKKKAKLK